MSSIETLSPQQLMAQSKEEQCNNCGGKFFRQSFAFRRLPKIYTGDPNDTLIPIPIFRCDDCGQPIIDMLPEEKEEKKVETPIITMK